MSLIVDRTPNAIPNGFSKSYWFVTESTNSAITHAGGATNTYLTNNANSAGAYNPESKSVLWDPSTNKFDFTSLKVGDTVEIVGYATFNALAAQEYDMYMSVAEGTASAHEHHINHSYYKTAKAGAEISFTYQLILEDADEVSGGARFRFSSVQAAAITVQKWSAKVTVV